MTPTSITARTVSRWIWAASCNSPSRGDERLADDETAIRLENATKLTARRVLAEPSTRGVVNPWSAGVVYRPDALLDGALLPNGNAELE